MAVKNVVYSRADDEQYSLDSPFLPLSFFVLFLLFVLLLPPCTFLSSSLHSLTSVCIFFYPIVSLVSLFCTHKVWRVVSQQDGCWMWGCHGDWAAVFHGQIRRMVEIGWDPILISNFVCVFTHTQGVPFSAKIIFTCQSEQVCTLICQHLPNMEQQRHLTSPRLLRLLPHISSVNSNYTLVLFPQDCSHFRAHSATPTLLPQMHCSTRSGSKVGVLLSNVLSSWMRLDVGVVADLPILG